MSYRLGVDVGGTFTDLLLINEASGETYTAKIPSTPEDSSIGVLNGIGSRCNTFSGTFEILDAVTQAGEQFRIDIGFF